MSYETFFKIAKATGALKKTRYDETYKTQYYKVRWYHPFIMFAAVSGLIGALLDAAVEIYGDLKKEIRG